MTALVAGEVLVSFGSSSALTQIRAGKLIALGLTTSKRWEGLPDVPTISEAGVPGYEVVNWYGLLVPAATPPAIVARLNQEVLRIMKRPEVTERMNRQSIDVNVASGPEEFTAYMRSEFAKWAKLIKETGAREE